MIGIYIGYGGSAISIYYENAIYYNRNSRKYYDDILWSISDGKVILNLVEENYKVYTDYNFSTQSTYTFVSTNNKWLTQTFEKINNTEEKYFKSQYDRMLISSIIIKNKNYKDVISEMKNDGYINIVSNPMYDVYFGIVTKDGDIEKISIDGETAFDSYLDYSKDSEIEITYHTLSENKNKRNKTESSNERSIESVSDVYELYDNVSEESVYEEKNADDSNNLVIGWNKEGDDWYYYNSNDEKEKSKFIEDYYVGEDGKMVSNKTMTINGKNYKFDENGKYRNFVYL